MSSLINCWRYARITSKITTPRSGARLELQPGCLKTPVKTKMLNEACLVTKLSRKHLINKFKNPEILKLKGRRSGRPHRYDEGTLSPLIRELWVDMERITSKRMNVAYKDWILKGIPLWCCIGKVKIKWREMCVLFISF